MITKEQVALARLIFIRLDQLHESTFNTEFDPTGSKQKDELSKICMDVKELESILFQVWRFAR